MLNEQGLNGQVRNANGLVNPSFVRLSNYSRVRARNVNLRVIRSCRKATLIINRVVSHLRVTSYFHRLRFSFFRVKFRFEEDGLVVVCTI